jgi:toxin-antitoxin system PIN domain toxin
VEDARRRAPPQARPVSVALDSNVLLYAVNADDPRQRTAREVLSGLAEGTEVVYLFWPVVMGFLRIATRAGIFKNPLSTTKVMGMITDLRTLDHVYMPGEDAQLWTVFSEIVEEEGVRGDLIRDAHIVALMRRNGVRTIITHDRDFRRFDGIKVRDPFA